MLANLFPLCLSLVVLFTPPPTGEELHFIFLGFVGFTLLVHRRLTLAQQGLSLVSLVSFPYSAFKTAHRSTRG